MVATVKSRLLLISPLLLRLCAAVVVACDLALLGMVAYHWYNGGVGGLKSWIIHTHATFEPRRWEIPVDQLVRDSYREFAVLVCFLFALTVVLIICERRITKLSKTTGGSSQATTH